jgi:hypothetical protein
VALLVRTRRGGFSYWCALAMTVALAGCAFVLSFDALRELATALGMPGDRAWLWPVAIDVSIANSTVSLLSLSPPSALRDSTIRDGAARRTAPEVTADGGASAARGAPVSAGDAGGGFAQSATAAVSRPPSAGQACAEAAASGETAAQREWRSAADELVRAGVTSKDPAIVAAVLADHAAGTAPSTISRRHRVHHSTVGRILAGVAHLGG